MPMTRREFLIRIGAAGALTSFDCFTALNALAITPEVTDYKALVCVFLLGGNDGNNTIIPIDPSEYSSTYGMVRTTADIAIPQASLLPLTQAAAATRFGLHPGLSGLQNLWDRKRLAVLFNVGTLVEPLTKADYANGRKPEKLFSHSDQQREWQAALSLAQNRSGWAGRMADNLNAANGYGPIPMAISIAGSSLFLTGNTTSSLAIPAGGSFNLSGFTSDTDMSRYAAMRQLAAMDRDNRFISSASDVMDSALATSAVLDPIINPATGSAALQALAALNTPLANQLLQVARLIEARDTLSMKRQIFFVALNGFDTHGSQLPVQQSLFAQLGPALQTFTDATEALGVANNVTTFTLSDFGRTLKPASGGGSDHAWGNHHFIIGGAVNGGDFYGTFPTLRLGNDSADDISNEGRWLPTTALDQYAATLATWFGVSPADLPYVLPNIGRFQSSDLGFLSSQA